MRLARRLVAGLAGLALGVCGAVASGAPVQAQDPPTTPPKFFDTCDGTNVFLPGGGGQKWVVEVGGEHFWPGEGDLQPNKWGKNIFVPSGSSEVTFYRLDENGVPAEVASHTWQEPAYCALIPDPDVTQPSCDALGEIAIPEFSADAADPLIEDLEAKLSAHPYGGTDPDITDGPMWMLDGERVGDGATYELTPGSHVVEFVYDSLTLKTWTVEVDEPGCEEEGDGGASPPGSESPPAEESPQAEESPPGESPAGEELALTGTSTGLVAGGAVLLLAVGAFLIAAARRRRINFTA